MLRLVLLACLFAVAVSAAPARAQATGPSSVAEQAEAALERGDRELAQDLVTSGLRRTPDALALLVLKLRLTREETASGVAAGFVQRREFGNTAKRILRLAPENADAHDALGRIALQEFLFFQHKANLNTDYDARGESPFESLGLSPEFLQARFARTGRFDIETILEVFPWVDARGPAEDKSQDARLHLEAAVRARPLAFTSYESLATLYVAMESWDELEQLTREADDIAAPEAAWKLPLWRALALYRLGETEMAAEHILTARLAMPGAEEARLDDLTLLLSPDEAEAYRADPDGFAAAYWLRNDPRLLTYESERETEHAIRIAHADLLFGWGTSRGAATDRGGIWLRYGPPKGRILFSGFVYPGDGLGMTPEVYEVWEYAQYRYVFRDPYRSGAFQTYSPSSEAYADVRIAAQAERDDYVTLDRQRRRENPQTSQYAPRQKLGLPFLASAFRGERGETDLVVAYGVPLASAPTGQAIGLSLRTGAFLLGSDEARPLAERRRDFESLPSAQAVTLPGATVWVGVETFEGTRGADVIAVEAEAAGGEAVGIARGPVPVLDAGAPGLSDVLFASFVEEGAGGPLQRRGFSIRPLPIAAASGADPFYIYFETYALEPDASGRTDFEIGAALIPADERSGLRKTWDALRGRQPERGTAVGIEGQGSGPDQGHYLILDASDLRPGPYTLVLTVRDRRSGDEASRERSVLIE